MIVWRFDVSFRDVESCWCDINALGGFSTVKPASSRAERSVSPFAGTVTAWPSQRSWSPTAKQPTWRRSRVGDISPRLEKMWGKEDVPMPRGATRATLSGDPPGGWAGRKGGRRTPSRGRGRSMDHESWMLSADGDAGLALVFLRECALSSANSSLLLLCDGVDALVEDGWCGQVEHPAAPRDVPRPQLRGEAELFVDENGCWDCGDD